MKRTQQEVLDLYEKYYEMVWRICLVRFGNTHDAYDAAQETFVRLMSDTKSFHNEEHEKAWLLRVSINACKDYLKSFFRRNTVSLESLGEMEEQITEDSREVLEAVLSLPVKYKDAVYLHYYEGYTAGETAKILGKNVNTVYTLLTRSRQMLREKLGGDTYE